MVFYFLKKFTFPAGSYFLTFIAISLLGCCHGKCIIDKRSRCKNFSKELKGLSKLIGNLKTCLKDEVINSKYWLLNILVWYNITITSF